MSAGKVILAIAVVAALFFAGAVGCRAFRTRLIDSYAITYQVTANSGSVQKIDYAHSPDGDRDAEPVTETVDKVSTPWSQTTIVGAGRSARVVVTPAVDAVAGCRIVLDQELGPAKEKVLSHQLASTAGHPVTCQVTLPADERFGDGR
ncbi:MmpS family transport accessory protein [Amycolatopsis sp. cmx-4-61]|uniref:MmpS family transport accessory protein n=1 Tax=Amycolatopsis sp. cmx-4-61 TaxID=2790937 RepID=UPI003978B61A